MQSFRPKVMCIGIVCIERRCSKSTIQKILDRIVQILVVLLKKIKKTVCICVVLINLEYCFSNFYLLNYLCTITGFSRIHKLLFSNQSIT